MADLFEHAAVEQAATRAPGVELNPEQRAAAQHGEGPLVVVAGAGTGKTHVITERIRYLLEAQPQLTGAEILGLTFTDKAAAEMKRRVISAARPQGKAAMERAGAVTLSTFHSFCNALLQEAEPDLKAIDKVDHWILLRRNLPLLQLEHYRRLAEPGEFLGDFCDFFSRCQDELVSPQAYQQYVSEQAENYRRVRGALPEDERLIRDEEIAKLQELARAYHASDLLLRERKLLTFGSQIMDAVTRLQRDSALLEKLRARYRYILVDEFQDTNIAQLELLWLVGGERPNMVVVGDHRQAIYRFRGASFGSFSIFLNRFASGREPRADLIRPLTLNYRSAGRILRVAGQVIRHNEKPKNIPEYALAAAKPDGEKVRIVSHNSTDAEAQWVCQDITRLHDVGAKWSAFAVLYRNHIHREKLVGALKSRRIPFVIQNLSILSHRLVRDLIAYLRLIDRPADDVACARVLAMSAWGLEPVDLMRLLERAKTNRAALWDTMQSAQSELPFAVMPGAAAANGSQGRTREMVELITDLRTEARRMTASELFGELSAALEIDTILKSEDRAYCERLGRFVREWEPRSETQRLKEFVEYLDYFEQAGGSINLEQESGGDAVQLMTVHAAKGLEFDHVYVLRMVRNGFPSRERPHLFEFPRELMKEEQPEGDFRVQEERRLFYVAITRARRRLTLNTVERERSKPSPFLDDILMDPYIKRHDVEQLAPAAVAPPEPPDARQSDLFGPAIPAGGSARSSTQVPVSQNGEANARVARPRWPHGARVGSRITEWALDYRPPVFEPLKLSPSGIGTLQKCPQKYLFERGWGLRGGPAATMTFGSVMHTVIKYLVQEIKAGRDVPFAEIEKKFHLEWTSAGFEDDYQEQEYKKDGVAQLRAFYETCSANPADVLAQEKAFSLPLENNVVLVGRMDQVNRIGPDEQEIIDYKTGRPRDAEKARKDLQLSVYALAAREVFDWNPARLTLYNLQTNQAVSATRDEKKLNKVRAEIQEAAANIRAGEFPAHPGFLCRYCDYEAICPAREQGAPVNIEE